MRQRLAARILLMAMFAVFLAGCTAYAGEPNTIPAEEEKKLTQEVIITKEKYLKSDDMQPFLGIAEKKYVIPGLKQAVIPQGMDYSRTTGLLYISGYYKLDRMPSVMMAVDADTGEYCAEYFLYLEDGTPFTSHVGGVAVTEDTLFVSAGSDNSGTYAIAVIPLEELPTEGSHDIRIHSFIASAISPSFLNCSNGYLWVGNFYYPSAGYSLCPEMNYTTETCDGEFGCYILGYDLSQTDLFTAEDRYPMPQLILIAPDRIQGITCTKENGIFLSQSYGRKNDSTIFHYDVDLTNPGTTAILNGQEIPAICLDHMFLREKLPAMPMTEALCLGTDGQVLVLFESGAVNYSDGRNRTDHVWQMNMEY